MSTRLAGLFEMFLVFGGVLGILAWQLISVNRSLRKDRERDAESSRQNGGTGSH